MALWALLFLCVFLMWKVYELERRLTRLEPKEKRGARGMSPAPRGRVTKGRRGSPRPVMITPSWLTARP